MNDKFGPVELDHIYENAELAHSLQTSEDIDCDETKTWWQCMYICMDTEGEFYTNKFTQSCTCCTWNSLPGHNSRRLDPWGLQDQA